MQVASGKRLKCVRGPDNFRSSLERRFLSCAVGANFESHQSDRIEVVRTIKGGIGDSIESPESVCSKVGAKVVAQ